MNISGQTVIVSGGNSGLGAACVRRFLEAGAHVAVLDMNSESNHQISSSEATGQIEFYDVDVTSVAAVSVAIEAAAKELGDIRACVNCAGIATGGRTVGRASALALEDFSHVINVNLIGTFNVLRLAAEKMAELRPLDEIGSRGVIVNTASVAAFDGQIGQAAYAASKAGVVGMTLPIARDLGPLGIRVNTIAPGVFSTPMMAAMPDEIKQPLEAAVQFPKRLGRPEEFASLVAHVVENDYLNGETIRLDGGIRMTPR